MATLYTHYDGMRYAPMILIHTPPATLIAADAAMATVLLRHYAASCHYMLPLLRCHYASIVTDGGH